LFPTLEENLWVLAQPAPDAPGQWLARCLNLDIVSSSASLDASLRALTEAVVVCLAEGAPPCARRRAPRDEWQLVERVLRHGRGSVPPDGVDVVAAAQLQLVRRPPASDASAALDSVRRLPWLWLERTAARAASRPAAPARRRVRRLDECGSVRPPWGGARGVTMSKAPEIIVTTQDFERLQRLVASSDSSAAERLDAELARARVVAQSEVPADVVTMNSKVIYEDRASGEQRAVRVVYPKDAEAARGWVSVLAPIGSALLGLRKGQEIEWPTPRGTRHLRVIAVPYQPESEGNFAL